MPIYKMNGKKDGLQKYRVRINYITSLGEPKQIDRVAYGADAAKELERRLNYEIRNAGENKKMPLQALYEEYIKAKSHEVRESTLEKYKERLGDHVLPYLGDVNIDKFTSPILQKWKNEIEEKGLSLKMKQNIYGELRALFNFAVKWIIYPEIHSSVLEISKTPMLQSMKSITIPRKNS